MKTYTNNWTVEAGIRIFLSFQLQNEETMNIELKYVIRNIALYLLALQQSTVSCCF